MERTPVRGNLLGGIRETVINLQTQQNREKLARFVFVRAGALISIAIPTLLYIAGASVQTIIEGTFISFISLAVYTGASAVGFYYGCKREIEKGKKERK
jgi:hypothetical protein